MKFGINQAILQSITQLSCIQLETPSSRLWNFWWIKTYTTFNIVTTYKENRTKCVNCELHIALMYSPTPTYFNYSEYIYIIKCTLILLIYNRLCYKRTVKLIESKDSIIHWTKYMYSLAIVRENPERYSTHAWHIPKCHPRACIWPST